jgi:NADH-quinone oxidoreductase subunit J
VEGLGFYFFGALTLGGALLMLASRNPLHGVLWLVVSFLGLSGLFGGLGADFLAAVQILVYAGAILVLFLFVIMLLNLRPDDVKGMAGLSFKGGLGGFAVGVLGFVAVVALVVRATKDERLLKPVASLAELDGGPAAIAVPLFRQDGALLAFEVVSLLLLAAMVGAVALTKRRLP